MDDERALKAEFRLALDDVLPPAPWLEAVVTESLRKRLAGKAPRRAAIADWRSKAPRWVMPLAAALLIAAMTAIAVATAVQLHRETPQIVPAAPLSVEAYQLLVHRDNSAANAAADQAGSACTTLDSVCPAPGHPLLTALMRWSDDLNRVKPPARFALIDAQLRRHIATNIAAVEAVFSAYQARDQNALDRASFAGRNEGGWEDEIVASIFFSVDGTVASYTASLTAAKLSFDGCATCESLLAVQSHCNRVPALSCETDIYSMESAIGVVEAAVTRVTAPTSLAAPDAELQQALTRADLAFITMANADLKGDQATFNGGLQAFEQALPAVQADLAVSST